MRLGYGNRATPPAKTGADQSEIMIVEDGADRHLAYVDSNGDVLSLYQGTKLSFLPTSGLLVHYTFDSATISGNTVADQSGNGNDATITGHTSGSGYVNEGIVLQSGVGNIITFAAQTNSAYTVSMWFKVDSKGDFFPLINDLDVVPFIGYHGSSNEFELTVSGDAQTIAFNATIGQWYHCCITGTLDGLTQEIFIDGSSIGTVNRTNPFLLSSINGLLGMRSFADTGFADIFRVYSRVLSQSEITALAGES